MIRILIVDDQNLVQEGIKSLLEQEDDLKVVGMVKDGHTAVKIIDKLHPDIVLLDIEMPGMDGITAAKYISRLAPQTKVIILSSHEEKKYLTQALMAGAKGYIIKNSLVKDLKQSILAVNNGFTQIESRLLAKVFDPSNLRVRNAKSFANNQRTTAPDSELIANQTSVKPVAERISQRTGEESTDYSELEQDSSVTDGPEIAESERDFQPASAESSEDQTIDQLSEEIEEQTPGVQENSAIETEITQPMAQLFAEDELESEALLLDEESSESSETEDLQELLKQPEVPTTSDQEFQAVSNRVSSSGNSQSSVSSSDLSQILDVNSTDISSVSAKTAKLAEEREKAVPNKKYSPATIIKRSTAASSTALPVANSQPVLTSVNRGKSYLYHWVRKPQIAPYFDKVARFYQFLVSRSQPLLKYCRQKYARYQVRISPVFKQWYEEGWLTNIGFWILGLIIVLLIHRVLL